VKNKNINKKLNSGFTLIELIVSIAIVMILSSVILNVARFSDTHKSLTLARDEVRVAIRLAQTSSLSIPNPEEKHVCGYGLYIEDIKTYKLYYIFVKDTDFESNPNSCQDEVSYHSYNLAGATQIKEFSTRKLGEDLEFKLHIGESLFFRVPYSEVYGDDGQLLASDYKIDIENTNVSAQKSITINTVGRIE
jgi:prepilin-type N-terminal cleavage/methylation domain-containing protein